MSSDVSSLQALRYCQVATTMLVLYDHSINLDREINLVWFYKKTQGLCQTQSSRAKFDFTSTLYLLTRYLGEAVLIFTSVVYISTSFSLEIGAWLLNCQAWVTFISVWAIQGIMQVRVYAMWNRSRNVLLFMVLCFFSELVSTSVLLGYHNVTSTTTALDHMCSSNVEETNFMILYLPILIFECVLLLLVLRAVQQHMLQCHEITGLWGINPAIKTLTIYSVLYFFAVVFSFVATFIVPKQNFYVPAAFLLGSLVVLATRLVLAVREPRPAPSFEGPSEDVWVDCQGSLKFSLSSPLSDIFTIEDLESPISAIC
ncbi:hypothetical protein BS17DRAFT_223178 [Gyrodon lividus]|nr:hypothetical protein BS17DRAFT_223178 [Gyrodon lividus]